MTGYMFTLRCRWCGGVCEHIADGSPTTFDSRAVAKCQDCNTEWTVIVRLDDPTGGRRKMTPEKLAAMSRARDRKLVLS